MNTLQIAPDGVPAELNFEIPAPEGLASVGGVRMYFTFELERPPSGSFFPMLYLNGQQVALAETGMGTRSLTRVAQLPEALEAPVQARLTVNEEGSLAEGNTLTVYAWGAQTASGTGALNADGGSEPTILTGTIEVGQIQVLSWLEWKRLTEGDPGQPIGS